MKIASHDIEKSVYIIAEISANHCGDFDVSSANVDNDIGLSRIL